VILPLVFSLRRKGKENAFNSWAWTIGGILYIGFLLSYTIALRGLPHGRGWVFLAILGTFASDIFAYLVGRSFGRHKMAPYISPNKTWEGALGGVAGSMAVASLMVYFMPWLDGGFPPPEDYVRPIGYPGGILLGVIVSIAGQMGDLVKSLFKRNTGVKDSSRAVPGHGGFLDRMDSVAFAGVAAFYCVYYLFSP
jgi:phosphatidate cytidylyltransferase